MPHHILVSDAEAKLGALFHNGQTTIPLLNILEELGNQQPTTSIETDNAIVLVIINSNSKQKKINVHEVILGQVLNKPRTLLHLMGPRENKEIGLFY